ncbi:MAG: PGAP1 family protein, partial [uncultured bacterium]
MKKRIKSASIWLIFLLSIVPFSFSGWFTFSQGAEYEEIDGYQEWTENRIVDGEININPEATLVIKKGVKITFEGRAGINAQGKLIVKGTVKEPVVFQKGSEGSEYSISIDSGGEAKISNADISGGGAAPGILMYNDKFFANTAKAASEGAIYVYRNGRLEIESSNLHNNITAIYVEKSSVFNPVKVNRSKFINNADYDVVCSNCISDTDFKYNWWGYADGPKKYFIGSQQYGYEKIRGSINFSDWADREDFRDPVILVPGILGSQKKDGQWQLDLVFHTYDNLYEEFVDSGYVPEKDLFKFPYEWRDSNIENAKLLEKKIEEIKTQTKWPKVDVVAHSMGGLLTREYVESNYYGNDIDQLVTLGTPHNGAPEAYLKWEGSKWFWSIGDIYAKNIVKQEAEESGFDNIFDYMRQRPITSLKELLPVYDYLQDADNNYAFKVYPDDYPRNEFLENINNEENKNKLNNIEFNKIIGKLGNENITIAGFKVVDADMGKYWEHGYPHGLEIPVFGDGGMFYSDGDKTVPLFSGRSENIPADYLIEIDSDHHNLPTEAQRDVLELLTGKRPEEENRDNLIKNILFVSVFSPVDLQITAPDGNRIGKDFATGEILNEIENAYYTGYDTKNEFITIPNPTDGEYQIKTQGTENGNYRIEATKIFEDENNSQQALESTAIINGVAEEGKTEEIQIEVSQDQVSQKNAITLESIVSDIDRYQKSGMISKNEARNLQRTLKRIISLDKLSEEIENNKKIKEENQQKLQKLIAERRLKYLDALIKYIGNKPDKLISQQAKTLLIESLEYIKTRLL